MAKLRTVYLCQKCGHQASKWSGQCPACDEWNTLHEEVISKSKTPLELTTNYRQDGLKSKPINLQLIESVRRRKLITQDNEFNRVLGGGIVPGSITLIGGHPGIGKSTLLLQIALSGRGTVLYVSGEESEEQIKMRADRVGEAQGECLIYSETDTTQILKEAAKIQPDLLVIDSIQTLRSPGLDSAPGSVTQVRESTSELQRFAKESNIPIVIIGHINKDGAIAGPKILEHIVDTVLQFEGDSNYRFRILRSLKNRFGSTDEMGIYEMNTSGLRMVENPSAMLLNQYDLNLSGSTTAAAIESARPLFVETQALVSTAVYGNPQRSSTGFDTKRMNMLLAVLEKRCGMRFGTMDVFLNIAGGLKIVDPSMDLAVVAALVSSLQDIPVNKKMAFAGEVGLSGEIRGVSRMEQRVQEANRLGFTDIFIPKFNVKGLDQARFDIRVHPINVLPELFEGLFA
jgi:DNA repair protein RadA/Sms